MSAPTPDDAKWKLPVENRHLRRFATFTKNNQLLSGLLIAGAGALFSLLSLGLPIFVVPDVLIDIGAAALAVTYLERTLSVETEPATASFSTLEASATGYGECPECGEKEVEANTDCPNCGQQFTPYEN